VGTILLNHLTVGATLAVALNWCDRSRQPQGIASTINKRTLFSGDGSLKAMICQNLSKWVRDWAKHFAKNIDFRIGVF
jgi:hypothetical protein